MPNLLNTPGQTAPSENLANAPKNTTSPAATPSPADASLQALFPTIKPQIDAAYSTWANLLGEQTSLPAMFAEQGGFLNKDLQLQLQGIGLQGIGLQNQQAALARQRPELDQSYAMTTRGLTLQEHQARDQYLQQIKNDTASQAAQGSLFTHGTEDNNNLRDRSYAYQQAQFGIQEQKNALGYHEQKLQLQDQAKNLDLASQQLGLSKEELQNKTQQALTNLGMQNLVTTADIFQAMVQAQAGISGPYAGLVQTITSAIGQAPSGGAINAIKGAAGGTATKSASTQDYIKQILPFAQYESQQTGIPVSVMLAQSIDETGSGTSGWWTGHGNPAGIGVTGAAGAGNSYTSIGQAFDDYANHLMGHGEAGQQAFAAGVAAHDSPTQLMLLLGQSPWAHGHYTAGGVKGGALENLYNQYNLGQYDK